MPLSWGRSAGLEIDTGTDWCRYDGIGCIVSELLTDRNGVEVVGARSVCATFSAARRILAPDPLCYSSAAMIVEVGPADNWRCAIDSLKFGDELLLRAGEYVGGCAIRRGGKPDAPIVIRALDPRSPPRLLAPPRGANAMDVWADHVAIRGLHFGPSLPGSHAVTLRGASGITVEDCDFEGIGGLAVVETMNGRSVVIRRNTIRHSRSTAMYFGCHEGGCSITDLVIEANIIEDISAPAQSIGYGIQIKLNSIATIRDNVIRDTKGPSIMVYGAADPQKASVIERNVVAGSRRSSGIVIGGGPAIVRNNIAVRNAEAGIALEDYGCRGLLRAIEVTGNTLHGNRWRGVAVPRRRPVEAAINSNVDCSDGVCH